MLFRDRKSVQTAPLVTSALQDFVCCDTMFFFLPLPARSYGAVYYYSIKDHTRCNLGQKGLEYSKTVSPTKRCCKLFQDKEVIGSLQISYILGEMVTDPSSSLYEKRLLLFSCTYWSLLDCSILLLDTFRQKQNTAGCRILFIMFHILFPCFINTLWKKVVIHVWEIFLCLFCQNVNAVAKNIAKSAMLFIKSNTGY